MTETYKDYVHRIAITLPEEYIDIKTGESHSISQEIKEQLAYHAENNTLVHLIFSALDAYLTSHKSHSPHAILQELAEIKKMIAHKEFPVPVLPAHEKTLSHSPSKSTSLNMQEVEDVLEAFSG